MKTLFAFSLGLAACSLWLSQTAFAELENFQAADVVVGQPDFSQSVADIADVIVEGYGKMICFVKGV